MKTERICLFSLFRHKKGPELQIAPLRQIVQFDNNSLGNCKSRLFILFLFMFFFVFFCFFDIQ